MSIFITGDMHGSIDIDKFENFGEGLTRKDFVIITGDFGLLWLNSPDSIERYWRDWLDSKPWTTLFLDGNHENFKRLNELPEIDMFGRSKVGKYTDHIFHLKRGHHYIIDGTSFFVMGGGVSIDKMFRQPHISWWEEEMPNHEEYSTALETLEKLNYKVDVILTHTAPEHILEQMPHIIKESDQLSIFLESLIADHNIQFEHWFFAHYHIDKDYEGRYHCSYNRILELRGD